MNEKLGRTEPQIIAFGGCGVSDSDLDTRIFRYVLSATGVDKPRVALLTAASSDNARLVEKLHVVFQYLGAVTTHLLTSELKVISSLGRLSQKFDLIHVEGGNTAYLLQQLRRSGMDLALYQAWLDGVVLTGTSAGASCWFDHAMGATLFSFIESDDAIVVQPGLGFLPYSICVHYDDFQGRKEAYHTQISAGLQPGFGLDEDAGLHFYGTTLIRILARREGASASKIYNRGGVVNVSTLWGEQLESVNT